MHPQVLRPRPAEQEAARRAIESFVVWPSDATRTEQPETEEPIMAAGTAIKTRPKPTKARNYRLTTKPKTPHRPIATPLSPTRETATLD